MKRSWRRRHITPSASMISLLRLIRDKGFWIRHWMTQTCLTLKRALPDPCLTNYWTFHAVPTIDLKSVPMTWLLKNVVRMEWKPWMTLQRRPLEEEWTESAPRKSSTWTNPSVTSFPQQDQIPRLLNWRTIHLANICWLILTLCSTLIPLQLQLLLLKERGRQSLHLKNWRLTLDSIFEFNLHHHQSFGFFFKKSLMSLNHERRKKSNQRQFIDLVDKITTYSFPSFDIIYNEFPQVCKTSQASRHKQHTRHTHL